MFLESIPNTSGYMIAGYVIAFTIIGLYVLSLYLRNSNLKRDSETLESLLTREKPKGKPAKKK